MSAGQISEATGINRDSAYAVLSKLKSDGQVDVEDGKYGVAVPSVASME